MFIWYKTLSGYQKSATINLIRSFQREKFILWCTDKIHDLTLTPAEMDRIHVQVWAHMCVSAPVNNFEMEKNIKNLIIVKTFQ